MPERKYPPGMGNGLDHFRWGDPSTLLPRLPRALVRRRIFRHHVRGSRDAAQTDLIFAAVDPFHSVELIVAPWSAAL